MPSILGGVTSDERAATASGRRPRCWGAALRAGAFVASLSHVAASQPAPVAPARADARDDFLVWHAPPGCSTAAAIRERVSELLGEPELDLRHVRRVEGRVSEARGGWALHLTLVDALGKRERQLESPHCADLAEAAAVAISLAFEAARARERAEPALAAEPAASAAPAPEPPPPAAPGRDSASPAPPPALAASGALEPSLGAELWLDARALPSAAGGVSLVFALRSSDLRLGAFGAWLPGVERSVGPGQSIHFSLLLGGVRACYTLGHGILDTALCAGFEAGRLSARSAGLVSARSVSDLWLAPQLGLELTSALSSHLALHLRADAIAPLLRQGYAVNETDDVHHVAGLGVRAAFGFLVGF